MGCTVDVDVDVVVAGAGPGGLAAAVIAARAGLAVRVIDPLDRIGGNAAISTGYIAVLESDEQRDAGITDTVESFVDDLRVEVDQYANEPDVRFDVDLAQMFARSTEAIYRLLIELGFKFDGFVDRPAQHSVPRVLKMSDPSTFDSIFRAELNRLGVELRLGTKATALVVADGIVRGLRTEDGQGRAGTVTANAVVLATGGYQGNPRLRSKASPLLPADAPFLGVSTCVGDGHEMIADVGGDLVNMGFLPRIVMIGSALAEDVISVGPDGRRFYDETGPSEDRVRHVDRASGSVHYVFDDAARRRYPALVEQFPEPIWSADSLSELARLIECSPAVLDLTVSEWNDTVTAGQIPDRYGRRILPPSGRGIVEPPFHAARCRVGSAFTIGGARIDRAARVLDATGEAIPHLYAVGDCVGSLNASSGTGGVHITSALVFGRAAATHIARSRRSN